MRNLALGGQLLVCSTMVAPLAAQRSPLRDLPPLQIVIDHLYVPFHVTSPAVADSLRNRVIARLRAAGVPVTDRQEPVTWGSFLYGPKFPVSKPTLFVSLNMVPDGCAFVANVYVWLPVALVGHAEKTPVALYASRSFIYTLTWRDHEPALKLVDEFIDLWRSENGR